MKRRTFTGLGNPIAAYLETPASFDTDSFLSDVIKGGAPDGN